MTRRTGLPYSEVEGDPLPQSEKLYKLGNCLAGQVSRRWWAGGTHRYTQEGQEAKKGFTAFRHLGGTEVVEVKEQVSPGDTVVCYQPCQGDRLCVRLVTSSGDQEEVVVDNVLAMVGYRPDTSLTQELQVRLLTSSHTESCVSDPGTKIHR